ncbi:response regulator transcription factor [Nigerium massiliense]|uniref:response regulator transcription factor n=1 Tax=Nigerium massiliense TaxID=1522317 RepID=UPI000693982A|nr:response regulator transcription factor [Nigerium massiliense]
MDESPLVLAGLRALCANDSLGLIMAEYAPGVAVDIVLYDPLDERGNPRHRVPQLAADRGVRRVAAYSWSASPAFVESVLLQGANGYLSKKVAGVELASSMRSIVAGERVVDRSLFGSEDAVQVPFVERLTPREASIVTAIARGWSNQEIADRLNLSINSVKSYIRAAYRKIGVSRRSQAVAWAVNNGLGAAPEEDALAPAPQH